MNAGSNEEIKAKAIVKIIDEVNDPELRDSLLRELTAHNGNQQITQAQTEELLQDPPAPHGLKERLGYLRTRIADMSATQKTIFAGTLGLGVVILATSLYLIIGKLGGLDLGGMEPNLTWLLLGIAALFIARRLKLKR